MSDVTNGRVPRPRSSSRAVTSPPLARPAAGGEITAVLEQIVRDWPRQPDHPDCFHTRLLRYAPYPVPKACTVTPRQLAGQLLASDRFRALKLNRWLRRPDTPAIRAAVEALSPRPLREDIELLVSALTLAAENLRERRRALSVLVWLALSALACLVVVLVARG